MRLFLNILGLEYQNEQVNPGAGQHKEEGYMKLNPLGQVPTLIDGDEGEISLDAYPNINLWLRDVEALSGFIAMPRADS